MSESDERDEPPSARLVIDLGAIRRGVVGGLVLIVPISLIVALVSHGRRSGYGGWLFVAFVALPTIHSQVTRVEVGYFIATAILTALLYRVYRRGTAAGPGGRVAEVDQTAPAAAAMRE